MLVSGSLTRNLFILMWFWRLQGTLPTGVQSCSDTKHRHSSAFIGVAGTSMQWDYGGARPRDRFARFGVFVAQRWGEWAGRRISTGEREQKVGRATVAPGTKVSSLKKQDKAWQKTWNAAILRNRTKKVADLKKQDKPERRHEMLLLSWIGPKKVSDLKKQDARQNSHVACLTSCSFRIETYFCRINFPIHKKQDTRQNTWNAVILRDKTKSSQTSRNKTADRRYEFVCRSSHELNKKVSPSLKTQDARQKLVCCHLSYMLFLLELDKTRWASIWHDHTLNRWRYNIL